MGVLVSDGDFHDWRESIFEKLVQREFYYDTLNSRNIHHMRNNCHCDAGLEKCRLESDQQHPLLFCLPRPIPPSLPWLLRHLGAGNAPLQPMENQNRTHLQMSPQSPRILHDPPGLPRRLLRHLPLPNNGRASIQLAPRMGAHLLFLCHFDCI